MRRLGVQGYCSVHLDELYAGFDPSVFAYHGVGLQAGPLAPAFGPLYAELACNACAATWVGVPGEPCGWCRRSYWGVVEHQAELDRRRAA